MVFLTPHILSYSNYNNQYNGFLQIEDFSVPRNNAAYFIKPQLEKSMQACYRRRGGTPMMRLNAVAKCCGDEKP